MTAGPGSAPVPLRGEIWDVHFPSPIGDQPVVILTSNALIPRMSAVTVAVITGTPGPETTHIGLDKDAGVDKYDVSWANVTDVHTVPLAKMRRRRGRLAPGELESLAAALRAVLVL